MKIVIFWSIVLGLSVVSSYGASVTTPLDKVRATISSLSCRDVQHLLEVYALVKNKKKLPVNDAAFLKKSGGWLSKKKQLDPLWDIVLSSMYKETEAAKKGKTGATEQQAKIDSAAKNSAAATAQAGSQQVNTKEVDANATAATHADEKAWWNLMERRRSDGSAVIPLPAVFQAYSGGHVVGDKAVQEVVQLQSASASAAKYVAGATS